MLGAACGMKEDSVSLSAPPAPLLLAMWHPAPYYATTPQQYVPVWGRTAVAWIF